MIFLFILFVKMETFSILVNLSRGFQNYRHMTDLCLIHSLLNNNNIITYFQGDIYQDKRNIFPGKIFLNNQDTLKYNLFKDVQLKYTVSCDSSLNDILNGLQGNIPEMKYMKYSDNIFIYICGHGCEGAMKVFNKDWLTKEELMRSIRILKKRVSKIFLVLDTCEAESIISRDTNDVFILTTSQFKEPSLSKGKNNLLGVHTVDEFPFYFSKVVREQRDRDISLDEICKELEKCKFSSTLTWTKNKTFKLKDFFH
ncbi:GPI-anchor transamidase [Vairimorpha necatrix]|uniref:GPI-anchor transamidase n=1 Tax=Vairimorpha necatrix TaxID=6039 RepID=A0AAX4JGD9_9MICR